MAGLMQNDVILGYSDDSAVKDEFRGIEVRHLYTKSWVPEFGFRALGFGFRVWVSGPTLQTRNPKPET
jgi:hypothetical protein